jgi:uncharacterized small protein (DUF1192 family)
VAETKEHLKKLSELSEKIATLGESIRRAEKDLKFQWVDEIEQADLQDVKDHVKAVEDALRMLQEEICHIEAEHCREAKQKL